jgi:hypothetical protein
MAFEGLLHAASDIEDDLPQGGSELDLYEAGRRILPTIVRRSSSPCCLLSESGIPFGPVPQDVRQRAKGLHVVE